MIERQRIIEGSGELFTKYGIKSVTLDDLARNLGISKKTIYVHFKDKNELVFAVLKNSITIFERELKTLLVTAGETHLQLSAATDYTFNIFSKINPINLNELEKYYPDSYLQFQKFKTDFLTDILEKILNQGIAEGLYRADLKTRILAKMRINQIEFGLNPKYFPKSVFDLQEVQSAFSDHFEHGMATEKWMAILNKK